MWDYERLASLDKYVEQDERGCWNWTGGKNKKRRGRED